MPLRRFLSAALACLLLAPSAHAAHGIALYGELKYKPGFDHFDYVNTDAPKGGTFKVASLATFDSMNPYILKGIAAPGVAGYVYQTLMTGSYDEPQSYYGLIADSVTIAPDHKTARFTLNKTARWHDGKPITADDVVFSFDIIKAKGHPSYRVLYKLMTIRKLSTHEVEFTFADATQRELPLMAASLPILPKHYFCEGVTSHQSPVTSKKEKKPLEAGDWRLETPCVSFEKTTLTPPLGSGPYKITRVDPGRRITYERVPDYWGKDLPTQRGMYNFDRIEIDVYRDDVTAIEGIKSHQFDFHEEFIARNWATAYDIPPIKSGELTKTRIPHKIPRGMQGFIFNTRLPKFADERVREAIGLSLDFEWMNERLFYGAYERNSSYFNNTEFAAPPLPDKTELPLLTPYKSSLPASVFTTPYKVPTTDGSGFPRDNLIRAQTLLEDAGWIMKNGRRINAKTGEPLTIEFLMTQRTFERVIAVMARNLKKLGIDASFRYVDSSQYQTRIDSRQFDVISIWWNQGNFYPGAEQYMFWHSSQADLQGSQNLGGVKNPALDALTDRIRSAQTLEELRPAARALDRVLLHEHYVIPHWNINAWRVLYWKGLGRPKITPAYSLATETWWSDPAEAKGAKK